MASVPTDLETRLYINGEFVPSKGSDRLTLQNPWDESQLTTDVHSANAADIDAAVAASRAALSGPWKKFTGAQRAAAMLKFADLVEQHSDKLALMESLPSGRPFSSIKHGDVQMLASVYRYYAGWADKIPGKLLQSDAGTKLVRYEPLGVCAGIASWNATLIYVGWKIAPALAAGNTFIFKSSEKSPLGCLAVAPLFAEAGFPPGVVQFVSGARETGRALAEHMDINKISFTGSAFTGRAIQAASAKTNLKKVTLELGGKSPAIVFDDAPFETTVGSVGQGFLWNSGQVCAATSRVLVQEGIAEKFQEALKGVFESVRDGSLGSNPLEPTTTHGPIVDKLQYDRVSQYIAIGKSDAELITGGKRKGDKGFAIEPTIFKNPKDDSRIWKEEIFGPVLSIRTFKTEEEALQIANNTSYGLASAVFTTDIGRALRVSEALEAGGVSVNAPFMPSANSPFGGKKESGIGRELGEEGLMAYLDAKYIYINTTY